MKNSRCFLFTSTECNRYTGIWTTGQRWLFLSTQAGYFWSRFQSSNSRALLTKFSQNIRKYWKHLIRKTTQEDNLVDAFHRLCMKADAVVRSFRHVNNYTLHTMLSINYWHWFSRNINGYRFTSPNRFDVGIKYSFVFTICTFENVNKIVKNFKIFLNIKLY